MSGDQTKPTNRKGASIETTPGARGVDGARGFEPVADVLVLAAIARGERHSDSDGVRWAEIPAHLGLAARGPVTRKLRPQVDALIEAGAVRQFRRLGVSAWGLTASGRRRLARAKRAGEPLGLPEAPQHREWRQAREQARQERQALHDALRQALEQGIGLLAGEPAGSQAWLALGRRVNHCCAQLAHADYCLHEWAEPDDAKPNNAAWRRKRQLEPLRTGA